MSLQQEIIAGCDQIDDQFRNAPRCLETNVAILFERSKLLLWTVGKLLELIEQIESHLIPPPSSPEQTAAKTQT